MMWQNWILTLIVTTIPAILHAGGPREPLTFKDSGLYCGWNDYFVSPDTPFDFFIVQGNGPFEGRDNTEWNEYLKKARQNGKRVIAALNPQVKLPNGEFTNISLLTPQSTDAELDAFVRVIGEFFAQVDINELYAVTLSEEQIFWNGHAENLTRLYDKLKAKYDVPVYQWYSPSSTGSAPGISGYPNLKADGWIADEYFLDQPDMERAMRAYTVLQKPFIQIIWAGGEKNSVPFISTRFATQFQVTGKYNVPTGYFTYYGEGGSWGWQAHAPQSLTNIFAAVLQNVTQAETYSGVDQGSWDITPWTTPAIKLAFNKSDSTVATYRENHREDRVVRFINDAQIKGFANVNWDSSPVQLRPRQGGQASASVSYTFESPFKMSLLKVASSGQIAGGSDATLTMSVVDAASGKVIKTAKLAGNEGNLKLVVPGSQVSGQQFKIVFDMSGTARSAGDILAGFNFIDVQADVVMPREKVITLAPDAAGVVLHEEDLSSMRIYHTAEIKNLADVIYTPVGLHCNSPGRAVEVIQKFQSPVEVDINRLCVRGHADEVGQGARLGIGVSLDGREMLAKSYSSGSFNGQLEINSTAFAKPIRGKEFYVHLFLEGGFGVITSYTIDGIVAN
jgi:hypothetical protein